MVVLIIGGIILVNLDKVVFIFVFLLVMILLIFLKFVFFKFLLILVIMLVILWMIVVFMLVKFVLILVVEFLVICFNDLRLLLFFLFNLIKVFWNFLIEIELLESFVFICLVVNFICFVKVFNVGFKLLLIIEF